jgi:hypothetical protein
MKDLKFIVAFHDPLDDTLHSSGEHFKSFSNATAVEEFVAGLKKDNGTRVPQYRTEFFGVFVKTAANWGWEG